MTSVKQIQFLTDRARRCFNRYGPELETIRQLIDVRLNQLALAYTLENHIPRESVAVHSRVKTLDSFLKKLEEKKWPDFYYPTEVATDLIGVRVICWFLDDCYGICKYIEGSKQFQIRRGSVEDYIDKPKKTGYRSIHLLAEVPYDRVKEQGKKLSIVADDMVCEIQIRTKLQDAWGEFTHQVHYKANVGFGENYETLVRTIADRLAAEDVAAVALRKILQEVAKGREAARGKEHEGFALHRGRK